MNSFQNVKDIKQNDSLIFNQDNIEVNMFTSIRKDSMNFDEINKNLNKNTRVVKEISKAKKKKEKSRPKSKQLNLTPLDPKLYRIKYEEFVQNQNLSKLPRLGSAKLRDDLSNQKKPKNLRSVSKSGVKMKNIIISQDKNFQKTEPPEKIKLKKEISKQKVAKAKDAKANEKNFQQNDFESENCAYCLMDLKSSVLLPCNHKICEKCLEELNQISFLDKTNDKELLCPKCGKIIPPSLPKYKNLGVGDEAVLESSKCSYCLNKIAQFECLNCDLIFCDNCKLQHLSFPENQSHKFVPFQNIQNSSSPKCPIHDLNLDFFCLNDNSPICIKCFDLLHNEHIIKRISEMNEVFESEILKEIEIGKVYIEKIKNILNSFEKLFSRMINEQEFFIEKTKRYFQDIINLLSIQQTFIINQITEFFQKKSKDISIQKNHLQIVFQRFQNYVEINSKYKPEINEKFITNKNQIQLKKNLSWLNKRIFPIIPIKKYEELIQNTSYRIHSTFIHNPIKSLSLSLSKFSFLPLSEKSLQSLRKLFENSTIISRELINSDLLLTLPKFTSGKLLYRISEDGPSPEIFHEKCNLKGPTITLIKTTSHIFGGFNLLNYKNASEYEETDKNFLFSISDGKIRKPMRCKIIKQLKQYAIKQSEKDYSPGFGINDKADLFLAFKNLKNSYSKLNTVYKCPKGYNPKTFLAGKENGWDILEIEIYSIDYINDKEFYQAESR